MSIKVLLVDDEAYIRKILRTVIEKNDNFEVVGECESMTDALISFNANKPDVVFMDIEIKGSSGVDCAKVMNELNPQIKVIFATAHSEYMANAFEMYAFDYMVKPFDIKRIEHTLERLVMEFSAKKTVQSELSAKENEMHDKLMIKGKESVSFIDIADIVLVERENSVTNVFTNNGECFKTTVSLADIEEKLDDRIFLRSHKSYIINTGKIKKIEPYGRWTYVVNFKNITKDALLTKEKYEQIKKMYGG